MKNDDSWAITPIVVTTNSECAFINLQHLRQFAAYTLQPVVKWRNELKEDITCSLLNTEGGIEKIFKSNNVELFGYFVKGAPAYLTENINPLRQLANGTSVVLHSLTWDSDKPVQKYLADMHSVKPGEEIEVEPPLAINVEVTLPSSSVPVAWPHDMTLIKEHVVIPVLKTSQKSCEVYVCVDSKWTKLLYRPFGVEVG